jgi:hypothetical protein
MAPARPVRPDLPKPLVLPLAEADLAAINAYLAEQTPEDILAWALEHLPNLYQTTAFGLTGCAATDMLAKLTPTPPPLLFIDTLYHFPETLALVNEMKKKYGLTVHVYKPEGCETAADFEAKYGPRLWETDEELYDYAVKVRLLSFPPLALSHDSHRLSLPAALTPSSACNPSSPAGGRRKGPRGLRSHRSKSIRWDCSS